MKNESQINQLSTQLDANTILLQLVESLHHAGRDFDGDNFNVLFESDTYEVFEDALLIAERYLEHQQNAEASAD